jgi:predicted DNA-binding protein (UPF0251 family)
MTYSEEEFADALSKAVAEAVAPIKAEADRKVVDLQSKIDAFESAQADNEVAGQIAEIQSKLDAAELRASNAEAELSNAVAYLVSVADENAAAAEFAARREEVRTAVSESTGFRPEYIEERLDAWAKLEVEEFEAVLEDYKSLSTAKAPVEVDPSAAIADTAISNVRDEDNVSVSASTAVFAARNSGIDIRKIAL